ncbi:hypothetical protein STANM309S_05944 [Streptomyces tanashiensis]
MPTEASEVAVVAGKPAVTGRPVPPREEPRSEVRYGASSGWALICSQPSPSIRKTQFRSAGVSSAIRASKPVTPWPATSVGRRSPSEPEAYSGTGAVSGASGTGSSGQPVGHGGGLHHQRVGAAVAAMASERAWAKASVWRTVSGPSPASLTRRLRSSAVALPV